MLAAVFAQTGPAIGLTLDAAWALDAGENPVALAEKFADRLYGLHLKDFVFDRARRPQDVVVGTGNLDLPGLFATLRKVGFAGSLILEYEGDVQNPVPALKQCVAAVARELARARAVRPAPPATGRHAGAAGPAAAGGRGLTGRSPAGPNSPRPGPGGKGRNAARVGQAAAAGSSLSDLGRQGGRGWLPECPIRIIPGKSAWRPGTRKP